MEGGEPVARKCKACGKGLPKVKYNRLLLRKYCCVECKRTAKNNALKEYFKKPEVKKKMKSYMRKYMRGYMKRGYAKRNRNLYYRRPDVMVKRSRYMMAYRARIKAQKQGEKVK